MQINLREFYPGFYKGDYFVDVPDEVAEMLIQLRRNERSQRRRIYRNKANYSLDRYETAEYEALLPVPSAEEIFERQMDMELLLTAMQTLSDKQRRRLYEYFFMDMNYSQIARKEGTDPSTVRKAILSALRALSKKLGEF